MTVSFIWPVFLATSLAFEVILGSHLDTLLVSGLAIWRDREHITAWSDEYLGESPLSLALKVLIGGAVAYIWARARLRMILDVRDDGLLEWKGLGKPMLIPAKTTHRRTFPEKHAFAYSYLVVGIPVGYEGSVGGMISTNGTAEKPLDSSWVPAEAGRGWFHVDGADHLERGSGSLKTKLHAYLNSQVCALSTRSPCLVSLT